MPIDDAQGRALRSFTVGELPELAAGARQARHHRAGGHAERFGRLRIAEPFHGHQQQHLAQGHAQALEGGQQFEGFEVKLLCCGLHWMGGVWQIVQGLRGLRIAHGAVIDEQVVHDGEQPGPHTAHPAPEPPFVDGALQRVLHQIVGVGHASGVEHAGIAPQVRDLLGQQLVAVGHDGAGLRAGGPWVESVSAFAGELGVDLPDFIDQLAAAIGEHIAHGNGGLALEHDIGSHRGAVGIDGLLQMVDCRCERPVGLGELGPGGLDGVGGGVAAIQRAADPFEHGVRAVAGGDGVHVACGNRFDVRAGGLDGSVGVGRRRDPERREGQRRGGEGGGQSSGGFHHQLRLGWGCCIDGPVRRLFRCRKKTAPSGRLEHPGDRMRRRLRVWRLAAAPSGNRGSEHLLAVQADVQTFAFLLFGDAQADDPVDDLEDDEGDDGVVDDGEAHALGLDQDLGHIAFQGAGGAADGLDREHAGEHGADDAADGMHAEGV